MIYLIDDKNNRQVKDFGWTKDVFNQVKDSITPIYDLGTLEEKSKEIFKVGNIVFYHESFLNNTAKSGEALIKRQKLYDFARNKNDFYLVFFSGSKSTRDLDENIAYIPVAVLYQNLKAFIRKYSSNDKNLNYLLYGNNPNSESKLQNELDQALISAGTEEAAVIPSYKNLFFSPDVKDIQNPIKSTKIITIYGEKEDEEFSDLIVQNLSAERYDNIFVPLCFGSTLSDYNGLRLATHIRCTKTQDQTTRVFIYGLVGLEYLINHKYFNILKTKNVQLVDFSKKAFEEAGNKPIEEFNQSELPREISKLKLDPPKNYSDNHSIANEWAIYRWAKTIDADDEEIEKILKKVDNNLYFKYLQTIFPISNISSIDEENLKIKGIEEAKILYIDDEADKGWYEIFCTILADTNGVNDFDYLSGEFNNKSREEITELSIKRIKSQKTDIVILDYRLHEDDFFEKNIDEVTGLKILKKIKEINPGIQVIIFSATNKVWNFQALQDVGADGFIVKEGPENSIDSEYTKRSVTSMISTLLERTELRFLKSFYSNYNDVEKELIPRKIFKKSINPLPKEFVDEALKWFRLSIDNLNKGIINDSQRASSFLFLFSVLENLSTRIIDVDNPIYEGKERNGITIFNFEFRKTEKKLKYFKEDKDHLSYYRKTKLNLESGRRIPWHQKILSTLDYITNEKLDGDKLSEIIKKRNDFIHSNTTTGDRFEITNEDIIWLHQIIYKGLKNVI